jgi:hypothetical protein
VLADIVIGFFELLVTLVWPGDGGRTTARERLGLGLLLILGLVVVLGAIWLAIRFNAPADAPWKQREATAQAALGAPAPPSPANSSAIAP